MEEPLINAVDNYYKLKNKYEKQFEKFKETLRNRQMITKISKKDLRRAFINYEPYCVICKKLGGSIFTNQERVLKAVCGSATPCKLNIELNLGKYTNINKLDENYSKNIDAIKTSIIMTKLDFLFGYISDENAAFENFDKLRKTLGGYTEAILLIQKRYQDVVNNREKKLAISTAEENFYEEVNELKEIYKQYQETHRNSYINDMVEKYAKIIQPLAVNIRDMKYVSTRMERDDDAGNKLEELLWRLVQEEYSMSELEQEVYGSVKSGVVKNER